MKYLFTFLIITITLFCQGQSFDGIAKRLKLLTTSKEFATDTSGLSQFQLTKEFNEFCDLEMFGDINSFHVIDLNFDAYKDIIYSGGCNPYDETFIYLYKNGKLNLAFQTPGKLVELDQMNDKSVLQIKKEPCCCDHDFDLIELTIQPNSRIEKKQISFHYKTKVSIGNLKEIMFKGIVRTTPEINDHKEAGECVDEIRVGNHITTFSSLEPAVQIDKSGSWRLILFSVDNTISRIGWIKP